MKVVSDASPDIKAQPTMWISERLCDQALVQAREEAQQRLTTPSP